MTNILINRFHRLGPIQSAHGRQTAANDAGAEISIFHGFHKHWLLPMGIFVVLAVLLLPRGIGGFALGFRRQAPEIADD